MGCTFGLDMYIGTLCIGDCNCDKASSITLDDEEPLHKLQIRVPFGVTEIRIFHAAVNYMVMKLAEI